MSKRLSDRSEGYMAYPGGYRHWSLAAANKDAKSQSLQGDRARVEGVYSQTIYSRWQYGRKVSGRENPSKRRVLKRTVSDWDNCEHCAERGVLRKGFPMAGMARMDGGILYLCRACARKELNPSKRKVLKRVGAALKKWMRTNPHRVKGRKVKDGRAVTLKNMKSVTITRKSNGVVSVRGVQLRGRKR